jgi:hypothetical protein
MGAGLFQIIRDFIEIAIGARTPARHWGERLIGDLIDNQVMAIGRSCFCDRRSCDDFSFRFGGGRATATLCGFGCRRFCGGSGLSGSGRFQSTAFSARATTDFLLLGLFLSRRFIRSLGGRWRGLFGFFAHWLAAFGDYFFSLNIGGIIALIGPRLLPIVILLGGFRVIAALILLE